MKTEKVVVFDVDGTLFDTKPGIIKTLNEVLSIFGKTPISSLDEDKWIGPPVRESFKKYSKMNDEQAEKATQLYRKIYVDKYISDSTLYDGMAEVLEYFRKMNFLICIATMKTFEQIERLLSLKNMADFFNIVQTASSDGSKTKADMLGEIRKNYGEESNYYMIGDTMGDFIAAEKSNYNFIAVLYGYGTFNNTNEFIKIDNPKQLISLNWF